MAIRAENASAIGTLGWVNREGQMSPLIAGEALYGTPRLSPDGSRVAFGMVGEGGGIDIWIRELEHGSDTRLTVEGTDLYPTLTPDDQRPHSSAHDGSGFEAHVGSLSLLPCCLVFMVKQDLEATVRSKRVSRA